MIEDRTPRSLRVQTSASVEGGPVAGVRAVIIGVADLDTAVALFRRVYGWEVPAIQRDKDLGTLAAFPGQPVILASAQSGWVADRVAKSGEGPVALLLGSSDFEAARSKYRLSKPHRWFGNRVVWFDRVKMRGIRMGVIDD